jgi:predicted RNA-binding Zn ribbon-like protein
VANTAHGERDEFADADSVRAWWHELRGPVPSEAVEGVAMLRELRTLIRGLALRNNGIEPELSSTPALDTLELRFDGLSLRAGLSGDLVRDIGAATVAALMRSTARPGWPRVKACRGDDCRWVFVDGSRNTSRRWCAMAECGNRAKMAAYRDRNSAARRVE